ALALVTADKKESVEICFVPDGDYVRVLESRLPADAPALAAGPLVTTSGEVVGEHQGFARYTVGQRRGLPGGSAEPLYVVQIRPARREVVVGAAKDLEGRIVVLQEINWLAPALEVGGRCGVQIRYRSAAVPATVASIGPVGLTLALDTPARA